MPTYVYDCQACGREHETFQSIKDDPLRRCPHCKKLKLQRRIGAGSGILFKGTGFYQTDYRSSSYEQGKKAASEGSAGDSSGKTSSTETGGGSTEGSSGSAGGSKKETGSSKSGSGGSGTGGSGPAASGSGDSRDSGGSKNSGEKA